MPDELSGAPLPQPGVHGAEVIASGDRPRCVFSPMESLSTSDPAQLKTDAVAFFSVINALLQKTTVIPFRFPTLLADDAALGEFLATYGSDYAEELVRLRGTVQMNILLPAIASAPNRSSGAAYLESKRAEQAESAAVLSRLQNAVPAREWKCEAPNSPQARAMVHALVEKSEVASFREAVRAALAESAPKTHVSGPWPPAAFVNCYPDLRSANHE